MGYSEQIDELKDALANYSLQESKLSELYNKAIENAEKAHREAERQLEEQYYHDRNAVYADTARDHRNFNNTLAVRGLGFSGEAAQAKLNSNITISNRLGELLRNKNTAKAEYDLELAENKTDLAMDHSDKLTELMDSKNRLTGDIAGMELDHENAAADREAEAAANAAKLQADRDALKAQLEADKEMQAAEIQAEREMLEAELQAKYYGNAGSGASGSSDGTNEEEAPENDAYIPEISAKELANRLMSSTGSNYVDGASQEYIINKYLLQLKENYDLDPDYYNELMFVLKAYGYEETGEPMMRVKVTAYEAYSMYGEKYDRYFDENILSGLSENDAHNRTDLQIEQEQMDYIYRNVSNLSEFKLCCREVGISEERIAAFIAELEGQTPVGDSGGSPSYATRAPQ